MTKELFSTLNEILFNTLSPVHHQKILSFGFSDYNPPKPKLENEASVYEAFLHPPPKVEGKPWVLTHPLKSPPTHSVHTHTSPFPNPVSLIRLKFQTTSVLGKLNDTSGVYHSSYLPQIIVYLLICYSR